MSASPARAAAPRPAHPVRVLVVDDEANLRHLLRLILERQGYAVLEAGDGQAALELLAEAPDVRIVFSDMRMPRLDGMALLAQLSARGLRVVMMSAYGSTDTAVEALSQGAFDYISKPFRAEEIRVCVERILERDRLESENRRLLEEVHGHWEMEGFVGRSAAARGVMDMVRQVARYPSTVLITGESGTGKEVLARALHGLSPRAGAPFVAVNCAAIPENLLESELFGHERGAFTGAVRAHAGFFEQAHGGTLLLDEIGDMPLPLQTRLLRVLEDSRVRRIGASRDVQVDTRVVAATARDLSQAARGGAFREDLYYRLNVVHLRVPPLRERREDIPLLARALVERGARRLSRPVPELSDEALSLLMEAEWPGNVRQLEHALERALMVSTGSALRAADLPPELQAEAPSQRLEPVLAPTGEDLSIKRRSAELEKHLIRRALELTEGNRSQAARMLEISYKALVYKIRDYGLEGT